VIGRRGGSAAVSEIGAPGSRRMNHVDPALVARHSLWLLGLIASLVAAISVAHVGLGVDAHAYWSAWRHHLYSQPPESRDAYLYSPAFAQAIWPFTLLPWPVFCGLWTAVAAGIYVWLLAPLPLRWRVPALLACTLEVSAGNVWSLYALILVFGFRRPGLWAFPALTKVTPVLGPVWFAARREWAKLAVAVGVTAAAAAVSVALDPHLWADWTRFLLHAHANWQGKKPLFAPTTWELLPVELPIALALTVYAARTDRRWLLPVAMLFASPVLTSNAAVMLAAVPRLRRQVPVPALRPGDSRRPRLSGPQPSADRPA
jgi:hypothetical protein